MVNLNRIRTDPQVSQGEAYIRDTGISVSAVVSQMTGGKSGADIRKDHPELEAEDVEQALTYAVKDLLIAIQVWKNEGLTPLTSVKGYSQMLLGKVALPVPLTDEMKQTFTKVIVRNAQGAIAPWYHLREWSYLTYEDAATDDWYDMQVSSILRYLKDDLIQNESTATLEIIIAPNLPHIKSNWSLGNALFDLVTYKTVAYLDDPATLEILLGDNDDVIVQIRRKRTYDSTPMPALQEFWNWGSSPLAIAQKIIKRHGSEIQLYLSEEDITFEFHLPIWKETT